MKKSPSPGSVKQRIEAWRREREGFAGKSRGNDAHYYEGQVDILRDVSLILQNYEELSAAKIEAVKEKVTRQFWQGFAFGMGVMLLVLSTLFYVFY